MLEIISIHIPKTAGRSFYQVLKWAYGDQIDLPKNRDRFVVNGRFDEQSMDFSKTTVLHGHFQYRHIAHLHNKYDPKLIVWLRNPVDRVISNYFYNLNMNLEKPWKQMAAVRKELSLMEFASRPRQQNAMSDFLSGIPVEAFFFIGITERFDADINILGSMLEWPTPIPQSNENVGTNYYNNPKVPTQLADITESMRRQIRDFNREDVLLYEKIVSKSLPNSIR